MKDTDRFIVVRELYPETKGFIFKSIKCPPIDESREFAYSMDAIGNVARLIAGEDRDKAVKMGSRIFAVSKRNVIFSNVFLHVCHENGYEWNYAMEGVFKISDASKFLTVWAGDEGACGLEGIDSDSFAHRVLSRLEPIVRDCIKECRKSHGYNIADIQEKDALPSHFWSDEFSNSRDLMLAGLGIEVTDKAFLSPDLEMEAKINAAAAAQREVENQAKAEWQAVVNGKMAEAELEEMDRQRKRAEFAFEKEKAELEAVIKKQKIDLAIYEANKLNEAKICLQKALNDEEIRKQQAVGNVESGQFLAMSQAMNEVLSRIGKVMDKLDSLGVSALDATQKDIATSHDPVVAPRYNGMSENFLSVMQDLRKGADMVIDMSLEAVRSSNGYVTRDLVMACCKSEVEDSGGVIHIGDRMTLRLKSTRSGYLTLFNFGTSGNVSKIFPLPEFGTKDNYINAGRVYMLPGELMSASNFKDGFWEENGPATAKFGFPERVVAILTDSPVAIDETCFGAQIGKVMMRGGFDLVEESISSVFDLPHGAWCWGMIEAIVEG